MPALAALVLVFVSTSVSRAAEPASARAGAARIDIKKPSAPTPMVQRGLILPPRMLDVYMTPLIERPVGVESRRTSATVGVLWGIIPELHAELQIVPFYVNPYLTSGNGRVSITGRILKTRPVDLGVGMTVFFDGSTPDLIGYVQPSIPAIFRVNDRLRVDIGAQMPFYPTTDPHFGFRIPATVFLQINNHIHLGSTSSLFISDLRTPQKTTSIPIGLTAGYSAGPELGFAAFTPYITWTNFYTPATSAVDTRSFTAGIIADIAFPIP